MNTPNSTEPKDVFDAALIDEIVPMRIISPSWNGGWNRPPYILKRLSNIATSKYQSAHSHTGRFRWFDSKTGVGGEGAVALVAHVLKISPAEAARRIVNFLVPADLPAQQRYLEYMACTLSKRQRYD